MWAGARGPVSALAAFSIPVLLENGEPFPGRTEILAITFGVVILTLAVSLSLGAAGAPARASSPRTSPRSSTTRATAPPPPAWLGSSSSSARRAATAWSCPSSWSPGLRSAVLVRRHIAKKAPALTEVYLEWRREMLAAERLELEVMRDEGALSDPVMRDLMREIDVRETSLSAGSGEPSSP